jgi:trehalose 6-phosphate synthase
VTVVVSNRGPYRFVEVDEGRVAPRPGPGGLASALRPLCGAGQDLHWIAAAHDDGDRAAIASGAVAEVEDLDLQLLDIDPTVSRLANDVVANQTLWFLHHGLFDLVRRPSFDRRFGEAWAAFRELSTRFAEAAAEHAGTAAVVLVQDYQLALVPGMLRALRPDLRVVHFTHTPFCGPNSVRVLPVAVATELCASMASGPAGFHTARWARAYEASAGDVLGAAPDHPAFVAPLGPDEDALTESMASTQVATAIAALDERVGDRRVLVRVDRIDPSKNIVRGFAAFDRLLEQHAEWRERVVFVAKQNASRETLPEYLAYRREVELAAERVNDRWGRADWEPVVLDTHDDHPHALAALARSDVLVVNPIKDGLNLVAKEGPLVNRRDGVLCLSPDAGAWDELGEAALPIHPYDLEQAAAVLHEALAMAPAERATRAATLRQLARARTPQDWLEDQLRAAG